MDQKSQNYLIKFFKPRGLSFETSDSGFRDLLDELFHIAEKIKIFEKKIAGLISKSHMIIKNKMATANVLIAIIVTVVRLIQINRIHQKICYLMFSASFIPNMAIFTIQLKVGLIQLTVFENLFSVNFWNIQEPNDM